jgi:uncharacterized membrane protein
MPRALIAYLAALIFLVAADAVWLSTVVGPMYNEALGHLMRPEPLWAAAAAFYLAYPVGIVVFGILPAGSWRQVAMRSGLYGLLAYATYDLTNLATLQDWPLDIVLLDMAWGAVLTAASGAVGFWVMRRFAR